MIGRITSFGRWLKLKFELCKIIQALDAFACRFAAAYSSAKPSSCTAAMTMVLFICKSAADVRMQRHYAAPKRANGRHIDDATANIEDHDEASQMRQPGDALAKRRDIDEAALVTEVYEEALRIHQRGDGVANGRHIDDASENIENHEEGAAKLSAW